MALGGSLRETADMVKRTVAAVLWFFSGWTLGAMVAYFLGVSAVLGPVLGIACAALIAGDPMHRIWEVQDRPRVEARLAELVAERQV